MSFKKTMKTAPESARVFANGDISVVREGGYVKGEPMFGYYKKTPKGYSFEKPCFTGRAASGYNHAKMNNPDFVPYKAFEKAKSKAKASQKEAPKPKAKPAKAKLVRIK